MAYLVLAHRRPERVEALIDRILELSPGARVLVHWDPSSSEALDGGSLPDRARLLSNPIRASWGGWSLVEATLRMITAAREWFDPDLYVLVSGEDWPAVALEGWERDLVTQGVDALVNARPVGNRLDVEIEVPLSENEHRRYGDRWMILPLSGSQLVDRLLRRVARRLETLTSNRHPAVMDYYTRGTAIAVRPAAPLPHGWIVQRGDQWMTLGRRAVDAVLTVDPRVTARFRRTLIPDEAYLHTIVLNTPGLTVRPGLSSYAPWERFGRLPNLVLREEDLPALVASGAPFGRKIGEGELESITHLLDSVADRGGSNRPIPGRTP